MAENTHDIGDLVELIGTYSDINNILHDPTGVFIEVEEPDATYIKKTFGVDPEVIRDSLGTYHMNFSPIQEGRHGYRWSATGIGQSAEEKTFLIRKQLVKP